MAGRGGCYIGLVQRGLIDLPVVFRVCYEARRCLVFWFVLFLIPKLVTYTKARNFIIKIKGKIFSGCSDFESVFCTYFWRGR